MSAPILYPFDPHDEHTQAIGRLVCKHCGHERDSHSGLPRAISPACHDCANTQAACPGFATDAKYPPVSPDGHPLYRCTFCGKPAAFNEVGYHEYDDKSDAPTGRVMCASCFHARN